MSLMLVAPSAIAAAIDTSATPRSTSGGLPGPRERRPQRRSQPGLVRELAQQHRARMTDQAIPAGSDLQAVVPPRMLHGEERS